MNKGPIRERLKIDLRLTEATLNLIISSKYLNESGYEMVS